jgi:hypothetical protein
MLPVRWILGVAVILIGAMVIYTHVQRQRADRETAACHRLLAESSLDSPAFKQAMADLGSSDTIGAIARCSTVLGVGEK